MWLCVCFLWKASCVWSAACETGQEGKMKTTTPNARGEQHTSHRCFYNTRYLGTGAQHLYLRHTASRRVQRAAWSSGGQRRASTQYASRLLAWFTTTCMVFVPISVVCRPPVSTIISHHPTLTTPLNTNTQLQPCYYRPLMSSPLPGASLIRPAAKPARR